MSAFTSKKFVKFLVPSVLCAQYAAAITSLYIPGFDPQPVTANELGVGSDGLTTWLIAPGVSSGTLDDSGFFGPATLVLGPTTAALTYIDPTVGMSLIENCNIQNGEAVCVDVVGVAAQDGVSATTVTQTEIESVQPFAVQTGGTPGASVTPGVTQTALPTGTASGGPAATSIDAGSSPAAATPNTGSSSGFVTSSASSASGSGSAKPPSSTTGGAASVRSLSLASFLVVGAVAVHMVVA
ncbi:hypothetical protein IEO21_02642 [Rhodonia placenta]|uniref:Uncharacterized protein n=1 Tax=Rhodonia placenta TaxID=104341 RepID=A0A8H7P7H8_9APHY|nr:hypothetical protein IEO21_02642 [Postia placenta]